MIDMGPDGKSNTNIPITDVSPPLSISFAWSVDVDHLPLNLAFIILPPTFYWYRE